MILRGDCLEVMRTLDANSVDAIVSDPPYGLGFMGKEWDNPSRMGDIAMRRNPAMDAVNTGATKQGGRQRAGLDPFAGSGSTGRGAILEGFRFTGIELDPDYAAIADARVAAAVEQRRIDTAQFDLFAVA